MNDFSVGSIIKKIRQEKKITLEQLSAETDISISYLSLMERDLNKPTIENLNKVCKVLNITLIDLISKAENKPVTITTSNSRKLLLKNEGYLYESLFNGTRSLNCLVITLKDNNLHLSNSHITDQIGYILQGKMQITINAKDYTLLPGDAIYIEANTTHNYKKIENDTCVSIWFVLSGS